MMTFVDLFAGVGGFRRGMELAGHKCVGFCEYDKYAVASYTAMHLATPKQLQYLSGLPMRQRQKEILKEEYRNGEWYASDVRAIRGGGASPNVTVGASAHLVSHSVLPDEEKVLTENPVSFAKHFASCGKRGKKIDPNGLALAQSADSRH